MDLHGSAAISPGGLQAAGVPADPGDRQHGDADSDCPLLPDASPLCRSVQPAHLRDGRVHSGGSAAAGRDRGEVISYL